MAKGRATGRDAVTKPSLRQVLAACCMTLPMMSACVGEPAAPQPTDETSQAIVNGTREPQVVPLTEGEKKAIGWLHSAGYPGGNFCTGTLISPTIVITASHCTQGTAPSSIGFGVGLRPAQHEASFRVTQIHNHPSRDAAILVLSESATARVPGLVPIPANRVGLNSSWQGRTVEASGYGETRDASRDGRWFASLLLEQVTNESVVVNGQGVRGICFGDSGGPLLSTDSQGRPVVLAVESAGDDSCVGRDYMTRLDAIVGWMDPITGLTDGDSRPPRDDPPQDDPPQNDPPQDDPPQDTPPGDVCSSIGFEGRCDGDTAQWCEDGRLFQRDCASLGTECGYINPQVGYICDCGDVDYVGRCNGDVAEYCDNGRLARVDCQDRGQSCGFVNNQTGYFCTNNPTCGSVDARGICAGTAVVTCSNGQFTRRDCASSGGTCVMQGGAATCSADSVAPPPGDNGNSDGGRPNPDQSWVDESWADDDGGEQWVEEGSSVTQPGGAVCQATPGTPTPGRAPWLLLLGLALGLVARRRARP